MRHTIGSHLLALLIALSMSACPALRKPGCETDTECKGDRICEAHRCVNPGPSACPRPAPCPRPEPCPKCPDCASGAAGGSSARPNTPERPADSGAPGRARLVAGSSQVRGSLAKEVIRRIVRRHLGEVKHCYESALAEAPGLYGRVVMQFTIAGTGRVVVSKVESSTLRNSEVESCIARAVRRWIFPKPKGGGIVIVSYPFVLRTAP